MEDEGICVKMVCRIWIRTEKKMKNKTTRIKELIEVLNRASEAYYAKDEEMMSNLEYDALYDELVRLEEETGLVFSNSPTVNVGYAAVDELPKEAHEKPMLSLGKTKDREELRAWLKGQKALLSWKPVRNTLCIGPSCRRSSACRRQNYACAQRPYHLHGHRSDLHSP